MFTQVKTDPTYSSGQMHSLRTIALKPMKTMQQHNALIGYATGRGPLSFTRVMQVMRGMMQKTAAFYMTAANRTDDNELRGLLNCLGNARSMAALEMTTSLAASAARKRVPDELVDPCGLALDTESMATTDVAEVLDVCEACEQYLMAQLDGILEEFELGDMSRAALVGQRLVTHRLLSRARQMQRAKWLEPCTAAKSEQENDILLR